MSGDYYSVLGISRTATAAEVKARYRFLGHAYHPDKFGTDAHKKTADEEFKRINEAYETLSDPIRRARYDASTSRATPRAAYSSRPAPKTEPSSYTPRPNVNPNVKRPKPSVRSTEGRTPATPTTGLTPGQVIGGSIGGVLGFLIGGVIGFIILFILWIPIGLICLLVGASDRAVVNGIGPIFLLIAGGIGAWRGARAFREMFTRKS